MRLSPKCSGVKSDGTQCSRKVTDGSQPPTCHLHRPNAVLTGVAAASDTDDLQVLLRRLTKDHDKAIRLRAIEAILKWEERQSTACAACTARSKEERQTTALIDGLSDEERTSLLAALATLRAVRETIYTRRPELRPAWSQPPPQPVVAPVVEDVAVAPLEPDAELEDASDDVIYEDGPTDGAL